MVIHVDTSTFFSVKHIQRLHASNAYIAAAEAYDKAPVPVAATSWYRLYSGTVQCLCVTSHSWSVADLLSVSTWSWKQWEPHWLGQDSFLPFYSAESALWVHDKVTCLRSLNMREDSRVVTFMWPHERCYHGAQHSMLCCSKRWALMAMHLTDWKLTQTLASSVPAWKVNCHNHFYWLRKFVYIKVTSQDCSLLTILVAQVRHYRGQHLWGEAAKKHHEHVK